MRQATTNNIQIENALVYQKYTSIQDFKIQKVWKEILNSQVNSLCLVHLFNYISMLACMRASVRPCVRDGEGGGGML